jgi:threo-3-hydroxy-L-aspartate ammonia-lyase
VADPVSSISVGAWTPSLSRNGVDRAGRRLAGRIWKTPVARCDELDTLAGVRLWMKPENLQRGGSFKVRGALLAVLEHAAGLGTDVGILLTGGYVEPSLVTSLLGDQELTRRSA